MAQRLRDKVAIVTGGGANLGPAAARAFAAEGAAVIVADADGQSAQDVADDITHHGGSATARTVDVTDSESVQAMVRDAIARHERIDVLFHSAADVQFINTQDRRLFELPESTWHHMLAMLLTSTFYVCKYVGLEMLKHKTGSIILAASVDGLIGCADLDSYTAARGGIISLTRSFAAGAARDGIRVNTICPSFVTTDLIESPAAKPVIENLHLLPIATPEQIAPFAVYLASDESEAVTGGIFPIDSGYMAFKARFDVMGALQGR